MVRFIASALVLVVALVLMLVMPTRSSAADAKPSIDLPHAGISFSVPAEWERMIEFEAGEAATFAIFQPNGFASVRVFVGDPKGMTSQEAMDQLAKARQGKIVAVTAPRAPADAAQISGPSKDEFVYNDMVGFVVGNRLILVSATATDVAIGSAGLNAVVSSIVVRDPQPAVEHMAIRDETHNVLRSGVLMKLPEPFRQTKANDSKDIAEYVVRDHASGRDDFWLGIRRWPNPQRADVGTIAKDVQASLLKHRKVPPDQVKIVAVKDSPVAYSSRAFTVPGGEDGTIRLALIALSDGDCALLTFLANSPDLAVRERYLKSVDDVINTLEVLPVRATQPASQPVAQTPAAPVKPQSPSPPPTVAPAAPQPTANPPQPPRPADPMAGLADRQRKGRESRQGLPDGVEKTAMVGGKGGGAFVKADPQVRPVRGFQTVVAKWGNWMVLRKAEPLYQRPGKDERPVKDAVVTMAKDGYVVGGLIVNGVEYAHAMRIIFVRQKADGTIDPTDAYVTNWFGQPQDTSRTQLAGHGETIVGTWGQQGLNLDGIGLVIVSGSSGGPEKEGTVDKRFDDRKPTAK